MAVVARPLTGLAVDLASMELCYRKSVRQQFDAPVYI